MSEEMQQSPDTQPSLEPARPTIALAVPWCPWLEERKASVERLRAALGIVERDAPDHPNVAELGDGWFGTAAPVDAGVWAYREFTDKLPNDQWSEQLFEWLAAAGTAWCMQIQEDALVPENFWPAVSAVLEALPPEAEIVGLHVCHPIAEGLALEDARLFTTSDALVGVCWLVRGETMRQFVAWRREQLADGWREPVPPKNLPGLTEDTMLALFAMTTGRRIFHTIPALVDHDISMASVWGNDDHVNRRPRVPWTDAKRFGDAWLAEDLEDPDFWRGRFRRVHHRAPDGTYLGHKRAEALDPSAIRHVGRFYEATPFLARRWVAGFSEADFARAQADQGALEKRRLLYGQKARGIYRSKERVLVCTPTRGGTHPEYTAGMLATVRLLECDVENGFELLETWAWHEDLVRVRSRFLRAARETDCTAVHFRDADVGAGGMVVLGMLQSGHEIVCAPYPRRDDIAWEGVRKAIASGLAPETLAYHYGVGLRAGEPFEVDRHGCTPVDWMPIGCSIVRRQAFERMIDHYAALDEQRADLSLLEGVESAADARIVLSRLTRGKLEDLLFETALEVVRWRAGAMGLKFLDRFQDRVYPTVALFQLMTRERDGGMPGDTSLLGEDQAFCIRAREIGIPVHMYLGPGSPVAHAGDLVRSGHVEAFGLRRLTPEQAKAHEEGKKRAAAAAEAP